QLPLQEKDRIEPLGCLVGEARTYLVNPDLSRGNSAFRQPHLDPPLAELEDHLVEADVEVPYVDGNEGNGRLEQRQKGRGDERRYARGKHGGNAEGLVRKPVVGGCSVDKGVIGAVCLPD